MELARASPENLPWNSTCTATKIYIPKIPQGRKQLEIGSNSRENKLPLCYSLECTQSDVNWRPGLNQIKLRHNFWSNQYTNHRSCPIKWMKVDQIPSIQKMFEKQRILSVVFHKTQTQEQELLQARRCQWSYQTSFPFLWIGLPFLMILPCAYFCRPAGMCVRQYSVCMSGRYSSFTLRQVSMRRARAREYFTKRARGENEIPVFSIHFEDFTKRNNSKISLNNFWLKCILLVIAFQMRANWLPRSRTNSSVNW